MHCPLLRTITNYYVSNGHNLAELASNQPLVTCAILNYSLEHGICTESATAFAIFANFEIFLQGKFDSGKHWADVAEQILNYSSKPNIRAGLTLYGFVYIWFKPFKELAEQLFTLNKIAMKVGDIDGAMYTVSSHRLLVNSTILQY